MPKHLKISQCMIVKNEEDNIREALSWGQRFVYEQIVVDTGSSDNTVSIAESMGATVYHYEWKEDFASAKNFALSKASGDWIAFLDADETFRKEDISKLKKILLSLDTTPKGRNVDLIRCTLFHLDNDGTVFSSNKQDRIFRRRFDIQFKNRIHEHLFSTKGKKLSGAELGVDIPILHTGYSKRAYAKGDKGERNIAIIKQELERDPSNFENWSYLGDSLLVIDDFEGAKEAYRHVLAHPNASIRLELRLNCAASLLRYSIPSNTFTYEDWRLVYDQYLAMGREQPDVEFWTGVYMFKEKRWMEAIEHLEKALDILKTYSASFILYIVGELRRVYAMLADANLNLGKKAEAVKYMTLTLKADKYQDNTLHSLLNLFQEAGENVDGVAAFLWKLFDFKSLKEKLFLIKAAKTTGFTALEDSLYHTLSETEQNWLDSNATPSMEVSAAELNKLYPVVVCQNETDTTFLTLLYQLRTTSKAELLKQMKARLNEWKLQPERLVQKLEKFYNTQSYWGQLNYLENEYSALENRLYLLKQHEGDLLWLYKQLADYRSKRVLTAILQNWIALETTSLSTVKETSATHFDPDIISCEMDEVLIDARAGSGVYTKDFIKQYGECYQQIYCCDERPEAAEGLQTIASRYEKVSVLSTLEPTDKMLETASILRLNAENRLKELLLSYKELIEKQQPSLMLYPYYSYQDLWEIPWLLKELSTNYVFYLRYFGEDLIPTDFILYAVQEGERNDV